jgi:hypothetical protein
VDYGPKSAQFVSGWLVACDDYELGDKHETIRELAFDKPEAYAAGMLAAIDAIIDGKFAEGNEAGTKFGVSEPRMAELIARTLDV